MVDSVTVGRCVVQRSLHLSYCSSVSLYCLDQLIFLTATAVSVDYDQLLNRTDLVTCRKWFWSVSESEENSYFLVNSSLDIAKCLVPPVIPSSRVPCAVLRSYRKACEAVL